MGHVAHHAIVVTSWHESIEQAHKVAVDLGCQVTPLSAPTMNSQRTFVVLPDGSKEGWADSDEGDERRSGFKSWLRAHRLNDGSSYFEWAEVCYGSDEWGVGGVGAMVEDHEWTDRRSLIDDGAFDGR